ncbi:uncharacterized protein OCT59_027600 [Rhizophagus irregularis]|uniref:uncharacterized protein n=1 Tax=Rhizophagus irregularis TaxID=588596 RepID=UPI00332229A0|nr:hypothetical protein OCT59_027600 [Rhizophagus irregularis]
MTTLCIPTSRKDRKLGTKSDMTEPTILSTGGISQYQKGLQEALRILSSRCGSGAGVGSFGIMLKLGYHW